MNLERGNDALPAEALGVGRDYWNDAIMPARRSAAKEGNDGWLDDCVTG